MASPASAATKMMAPPILFSTVYGFALAGGSERETVNGTHDSTAILRMSCVMRIEQNFGPHIEQNFADLNTSCGSVSSCMARAVSGSSDNSNCRFQSNSKRAFDSS